MSSKEDKKGHKKRGRKPKGGKIITVTEEEIISAMRLIWERLKIVCEPSCSVPLAAILKEPEGFKNKKVVVILTGGNVDLRKLPF